MMIWPARMKTDKKPWANAVSVEDRSGDPGSTGPSNYFGRIWLKPWSIRLLILVLPAVGGFGPVHSAAAYDFTADLVTKGKEATQTNSGLAVINAQNGYLFDADIVLAATSAITNSSIFLPSGLGTEVLTLASSGSKLEFKHKVNTLKTLDKDYPDGVYTFTIGARTTASSTPPCS